MQTRLIEIRFTVSVPEVAEHHRLEAEQKAREAFIMVLLRHGDISAGYAAEQLGINRWQLSDLMDAHKISPFPLQSRADLLHEVTQAEQRMEQPKS
ncbi:MAG: UPF0175 family protein [Cyanobacteria bacterium P01_F01_bin.3]